MSEPFTVRCPQCRSKLKLKSSAAVGKEVPCPKCRHRFIVPVKDSPEKQAAKDARESASAAGEIIPESEPADIPPIVRSRPRAAGPRRRKPRPEPSPSELRRARWTAVFAALVWWNAHLAVLLCVLDLALEFLYLVSHWDEVYRQAPLGRFAVRRVARPLFVLLTAVVVWFQVVLPRDIGLRGVAALAGGAYLFLFGVIGFIVGLLASSVYERPIYAIQWSVVYLGASLVAYSLWGYGPESARERAERLMAHGYFSDALTAVGQALEEDPDDEDMLELERTLRDLIRYA